MEKYQAWDQVDQDLQEYLAYQDCLTGHGHQGVQVLQIHQL